jgi:nitroreductase
LDFFEIIDHRRSVRAYSSKPIEEDKLKQIFRAANLAPSAGNLQAYQVHVFRKQDKKEALAKAAFDQKFLVEAPVCLVFSADPSRSSPKYGKRGSELYSIQDATIAATFAMLAAVDVGLATVWVGAFDEKEVQKEVGVKSLKPVAMFAVGYPAEEPATSPRRAIDEIFHGVFPQTD